LSGELIIAEACRCGSPHVVVYCREKFTSEIVDAVGHDDDRIAKIEIANAAPAST
jgi:hypothetical protein